MYDQTQPIQSKQQPVQPPQSIPPQPQLDKKPNKPSSLLILLFILVLGSLVYFFQQGNVLEKDAAFLPTEITTPTEIVNKNAMLKERIAMSRAKIEELRLTRLTQFSGLKDINATDRYVEEENASVTNSLMTNTQISNYQTYVQPADPVIVTYATNKSYEQIYTDALSWVWVEDMILNQLEEQWLMPDEFLNQTPTMETNPVPGYIASDCESQAYTLVSLLRAAGMSPENVRVVTGQVTFGSYSGGHAWVEVYDEDSSSWFQLEATSGNYYDTSTQSLINVEGLPYDYFTSYEYPATQIWSYFNDMYYWDNGRSQGVVAEHWISEDTVDKQPPSSHILYELPQRLKTLRSTNSDTLQNTIENFNADALRKTLEELRSKRSIPVITPQTTQKLTDMSQEDIEEQFYIIIDTLEDLVNEGLTEEQVSTIKNEAEVLLQQVESAIDASNIPASEKEQLLTISATLTQALEKELTPVQKKLIEQQILSILGEAENAVESKTFQNRIKTRLQQ